MKLLVTFGAFCLDVPSFLGLLYFVFVATFVAMLAVVLVLLDPVVVDGACQRLGCLRAVRVPHGPRFMLIVGVSIIVVVNLVEFIE